MRFSKSSFLISTAMVGILTFTPYHARAITVWDPGVNATIVGFWTATSTLLLQLGQTISAGNNQIVRTIEASARTEREFLAAQEQNRRSEDARQRYQVPGNICVESVSVAQNQVNNATYTAADSLGNPSRGRFENDAIAQAIQTPGQTPADSARFTQQAHAQFCDSDEFEAYGNSDACPDISSDFPGGDTRIDSILHGARPLGTQPDHTLSQEQIEIGRLYINNSYRQNISPLPSAQQADTESGNQYLGDMASYRAMMSAAKKPALDSLARRAPNPQTTAAIEFARSTQSGNAYFTATASDEAQRTGQMSQHEFEMFDVYRRHGNPDYARDLQNMSGDNLTRELIRVQVQNNALTYSLKKEIELSNLIAGQQLASQARLEYSPILEAGYSEVIIDTGQ